MADGYQRDDLPLNKREEGYEQDENVVSLSERIFEDSNGSHCEELGKE